MRIQQLTTRDWTREVKLTLTALEWITIHGNVSLALRHPDNTGPSRHVAETVLRQIERRFKGLNLLDDEDIATIRADEAQHGEKGNGSASDDSGS